MFQGVYTALVTPFTEKNTVDYGKLRNLVDVQIEAGAAGLVPVGTTGESPTLSMDETMKVIQTVVNHAARRVTVIAGAGSNCTDKAVMQTKQVKELGADASLQVVPYYNKPTQEGMVRHFTAIAEAVDLPMVLYDVPGRTSIALENSTIVKLASHERIVGVKTANGSIAQVMDLIQAVDDSFSVLSGDDNLVFSIMTLGGHGVISVVSNLYPRLMVELCDACIAGQYGKARKLHYRMLPIFKAAFIESNPIPIKAAMAMKGYILETYRLPLCSMSPEHRAELERVVSLIDTGEPPALAIS